MKKAMNEVRSSPGGLFQPLVGAERNLRSVTVKALLLGVILSVVLASANAYIGLLVGMTVSASIPAAAVSMGLFRLFRRSNILENNLVQTAASAGESLVAGVIFTVPALVMAGIWEGYNYGPMVAIALLGGILGVVFTVPLRRALIVEASLLFPEGLATAEVLKTGGVETPAPTNTEDPEKAQAQEAEAKRGLRMLLEGAGLGAFLKVSESFLGWLAAEVAVAKGLLGGRWLLMADATMSPALLGVGYIVGLNIAALVFLGGILGTLIGVPLNWIENREAVLLAAGLAADTPLSAITATDWEAIAGASWSQTRRMGVGAMLVGGFWSLLMLLKPMSRGLKASFAAYQSLRAGGPPPLRTERDTPLPLLGWILAAAIPLIFLTFSWALGGIGERPLLAVLLTVLMLFFGFIFASVAGYLAGLVGSSNNPISGVTLATVVVTSVLFLGILGNDPNVGIVGPMVVLFLAALVCCAAAIAGDNMQDLKCGYILGATPWKQQLFQFLGVGAAALAIPLVLAVLDAGHGIGRPIEEGGSFLNAPQATLMRDISTGIFNQTLEWEYLIAGALLAVVCIVLDVIQERRGGSFRFPVLAVAVGIYLPLGLGFFIFVGGVMAAIVRSKAKREGEDPRRRQAQAGLILASGLITGEALMGVLVAIAAVTLPFSLPLMSLPGAGTLAFIAMGVVMVWLYRRTRGA